MTLLFITISLVFGLYFLKGNIIFSILLSIAYLIFLFYRFKNKTLVFCLIAFATGAVISNINLECNSKSDTYSCIVLESKANYIVVQSHLEKYYVYAKENNYEVGDRLTIDGIPEALKLLKFESQFDFEEYLNNKGIKREIKYNIIDVKYRSFIRVKNFKNNFLKKFDKNTAALIDAFLFNEKDYSSDAIKFTSELNLNHLFCLSGIYLQLIFTALTYLFSLKFSDKASEILPFIILFPYAIFSLSKIGTIRVYSLYLFKFLNKNHFKRRLSHIELVSILALIFITFDYHFVYQEAFYLGFLLSALTPIFNSSLSFIKKKKIKLIKSIFISSFFIPIQIRNQELSLLYLVNTNLILPLNLIFILFSQLSIIFPIHGLVNNFGSLLMQILEMLNRFNISIPASSLGGAFGILFYFLFFTGMYFLESNRVKQFKKTIYGLIIVLLFAIVPLQEPLMNGVYFINVGQGDSILIKNRTHTVMIDTGGYKTFDMAKETLIPFMTKYKITHIDALITTHDDFDHSGAKDSLMNNFRVNQYLYKKEDFPYKIGDIYLENLNNKKDTDDNDSSLVLKMNFINKKWLFMGDASTNVEEYLINNYDDLTCDILKIGHHGSKSSTSEKFLRATKPNTAIISVGANNFYKHPSEEVIKRLQNFDIKIRRTDLEGTISYLSLFT